MLKKSVSPSVQFLIYVVVSFLVIRRLGSELTDQALSDITELPVPLNLTLYAQPICSWSPSRKVLRISPSRSTFPIPVSTSSCAFNPQVTLKSLDLTPIWKKLSGEMPSTPLRTSCQTTCPHMSPVLKQSAIPSGLKSRLIGAMQSFVVCTIRAEISRL